MQQPTAAGHHREQREHRERWEMSDLPGQARAGRRYSVSSDREPVPPSFHFPGTSEDLHAWSIYRQVLPKACHLLLGVASGTAIILTG